MEVIIAADAGRDQTVGIRPLEGRAKFLKRLLWPLAWIEDQWLNTGYLERSLGCGVKRHADAGSVVLEVGAGSAMAVKRFLPRQACYNALDIAFSEFAIRRVANSPNVNLILGSARHLPVDDSSIDVIATKETLLHIRELPKVIDEFHRTLRPGGAFMCTIGNVRCDKYKRIGNPHGFPNRPTFEEFRNMVESHGFRCLESKQIGWWIPASRLVRRTYHLPLTSKHEHQNTNFVFLFEQLDE